MADLVALVPSYGRPQAVAEMASAFGDTCTADTLLVFVVDEDDPAGPEYSRAVAEACLVDGPGPWQLRGAAAAMLTTPSRTMVEALNRAAVHFASMDHFAVAFLGDDHRPRTLGWDTQYLKALCDLDTGIVYGNDLLQRKALPTQCAMTADIVRVLGWMAPPTLTHLYVDNFWRDLGQAAHCLRYLPDVVVEHLHPVAGKAAVDAGYERVNATEMYDRDSAAYAEYRWNGTFPADVANVAALRAGRL